MIIISKYSLNYNELTGKTTVISEDVSSCPFCNGDLVYRDRKLRRVKDLLGEVSYFLLRRLHCKPCRRLHTELPDMIQPYKHYDSATIQGVLDESEASRSCAADNSTIYRWKRSFAAGEGDWARRLSSVYATQADELLPLDLRAWWHRLKTSRKRWLAFVMKLLINNGHQLCTQFAFCPFP